jgi:type IV pilus assembly protein PilB
LSDDIRRDREIIESLEGAELWKGKGCPECNYTGYRGRVGLYELMPVTAPIRSLIISRASSDEIKQKALEDGYRPMRSSGLQLVRQGVTSLEEVLRMSMRTD